MQLRNRKPKPKGPQLLARASTEVDDCLDVSINYLFRCGFVLRSRQPPQSFSTPELAARHTSLAPYTMRKLDGTNVRQRPSLRHCRELSKPQTLQASSIKKTKLWKLKLTATTTVLKFKKKDVEAKFSHVRLTATRAFSRQKTARRKLKSHRNHLERNSKRLERFYRDRVLP